MKDYHQNNRQCNRQCTYVESNTDAVKMQLNNTHSEIVFVGSVI
jgi:hypothetical protein